MLRPAGYCRPDDPFYIATNTKKIQLPSSGKPPMDIAFKKQPIGVNKLSSLMNRMATKAGLSADKKLSNHSARKHLVQKLSDNNVPPTQIMQITGHKNIQSVNNYSHLNETQHKQISNIISNPNSTQSSSMSLAQHNTAVSNIRSQNVLTSSQNIQDCMDSMFSGNIYGGTFNISIDNSRHSPLHTPAKRRRIIVDDSDSD